MYAPPSAKEAFGNLSKAQARVASDVTRFNTVYAAYQNSKESPPYNLSLPTYKSRQDRFLFIRDAEPLIKNFIDRIMPNGGIVKVDQRVNVL